MTIETWPLDRIKPYERNARKIPKAAIDKVARSLKEYGWQQPIVVDADGGYHRGPRAAPGGATAWLDGSPRPRGHQPHSGAVSGLPRLADNRSHEEAGWDRSLLSLELGDLSEFAFDLSLTGFESMLS